MDINLAKEYDAAAEWCAKRGFAGKPGDLLPPLLSTACTNEILLDPEPFQKRIRETAYALAFDKREADQKLNDAARIRYANEHGAGY